MKNKMWPLLILLLPLFVFGQPAEEIVALCIKAMGGQEDLHKFADYKASGDISYFMRGSEISGTVEVLVKPNKYWKKTDLDFGGRPFTLKNVYDGKIAFSERNGRVSDLPSLNSESDLDHSILLLLEKNAKFKLDKETELNGFKVTGILVELNGKKTLFNIDVNDHVIREIVFKDSYFGDNDTKELIEKRIRYSNYKKIDGLQFPMDMTFIENGQKDLVYKFNIVNFSPPVDSTIFKRPDEEVDRRYWEETIH